MVSLDAKLARLRELTDGKCRPTVVFEAVTADGHYRHDETNLHAVVAWQMRTLPPEDFEALKLIIDTFPDVLAERDRYIARVWKLEDAMRLVRKLVR